MLSAARLAQDLDPVSLLGVDYLHLQTSGGSELYLTRFGARFQQQLLPENWYESEWFTGKRTRLLGTSTIYRLPTKPVRGLSLNLVVRFSRVGEDVPIDAKSENRNIDVEFNSPFEEFAAVMQLRTIRPRIFTKKPLAIFIPGERLQLWQTGRLESKIAAKLARHPDAQIDILRQYILLYGWIEGLNAVEAFERLATTASLEEGFLSDMTRRATQDLEHHGFRMADIKPEHVVLRPLRDGSLLRQRNGRVAYALIDYELLEPCRTRKTCTA
jgi:hypothetical protein